MWFLIGMTIGMLASLAGTLAAGGATTLIGRYDRRLVPLTFLAGFTVTFAALSYAAWEVWHR